MKIPFDRDCAPRIHRNGGRAVSVDKRETPARSLSCDARMYGRADQQVLRRSSGPSVVRSGLAFYLTILSLAIFKLFEDPQAPLRFPLSAVILSDGNGLVISALLVGVQAFILKAFCEYCLLSAALVLSMFLASPVRPGINPLRNAVRRGHPGVAAGQRLFFSCSAISVSTRSSAS